MVAVEVFVFAAALPELVEKLVHKAVPFQLLHVERDIAKGLPRTLSETQVQPHGLRGDSVVLDCLL